MKTTADVIYARLDVSVAERDAARARMDALNAERDSLPWWRFWRKEKLVGAILIEAMTMRHWNERVGESIAQIEVLEAVGA